MHGTGICWVLVRTLWLGHSTADGINGRSVCQRERQMALAEEGSKESCQSHSWELIPMETNPVHKANINPF